MKLLVLKDSLLVLQNIPTSFHSSTGNIIPAFAANQVILLPEKDAEFIIRSRLASRINAFQQVDLPDISADRALREGLVCKVV